jgi:Skp family chaperone for outer membrane proteins
MLHFKSLMAAFALAISTLAVGAPALAQGTKIVVVDQGRVLSESRAGADIRTKIENIASQMQRELEPTQQSIQQLGQSIEARTANMTPEAIQADQLIVQQYQDLQNRARNYQVEEQRRGRELQITERKAQVAFAQALEPVIQDVLREQNAQIMMGANTVMYALPATDVTDQVIQKLDQRSPTIAVTRERLPTQAAEQ